LLILKIIFKNKNIFSIYFQANNTLKNKFYCNLKHIINMTRKLATYEGFHVEIKKKINQVRTSWSNRVDLPPDQTRLGQYQDFKKNKIILF
jgi:hypothetical protein